MIQACRSALLPLMLKEKIAKASHPGLILHRYLSSQEDLPAKETLFQTAINSLKEVQGIYKHTFLRYRSELQGSIIKDLKVDGRIVIGLGGSSVLETNITLHHTYGTPIIPGSALKGLASNYCHCIWGERDSNFKKGEKYHEFIFGSQEDAGHIIFHDAWIKPSSLMGSLLKDIITVHHPDYYLGIVAPTDMDDPNPISFLSVTGEFMVVVSFETLSDQEGQKWAKLAMDILVQAVNQWGIGAKTSSGYGRLKYLELMEEG